MSEITLRDACAFLKEIDNVHIYTHIHPDGDALGSAFALKRILEKLGKRVRAICLDTLPEYLRFIWDTENEDFEPDSIITVDVADRSLIGNFDEKLKIDLAIDHHLKNRVVSERLLLFSDMGATGEIIFDIAKELHVEFDEYIAECLYTAIATDTGCFKYPSTVANTYLAVAELVKYTKEGNFAYLNTPLFITKSKSKIAFESDVIQNLKFFFDGALSVATVTKALLEKHSLSDSETGGVEALGKSIEGVKIALTFKERDGGFKVSMRSEDIDVSVISAHFGGGGHKLASGCFIDKALDDAIHTVVSYIEELRVL